MPIINRPQEVISCIRDTFPEAQVEGIVRGKTFQIECQLVAESTSFTVSAVLDKEKFQGVLNTFKECHWKRQPFDINRQIQHAGVSLGAPLEKWQIFQRGKLGEEKVIEVVRKYLYSSNVDAQHLEALTQLGLAPSQVKDASLPEDYQLLLELYSRLNMKLREVPDEVTKDAFNKFKSEYPGVYDRILKVVMTDPLMVGAPANFVVVAEALKSAIVGQDYAANAMANAVNGVTNGTACQKVLFVGPPGVGKTAMARQVALLRKIELGEIEMNNFATADREAAFVDMLVRKFHSFSPTKVPSEGEVDVYEVENAMLLFDEIEKADPAIRAHLLSLLAGVACEYTTSREVDGVRSVAKYRFKGAIFIGTSNLHASYILEAFNSGKSIAEIQTGFKARNKQGLVKSDLRPELAGRFDLVPFGPIPKGYPYQTILKAKLSWLLPDLKKTLGCSAMMIEDEELLLEALESRLYGDGTNIRAVEGFFRGELLMAINAIFSRKYRFPKIGLTLGCRDEIIGVQAQVFNGEWVPIGPFVPIDDAFAPPPSGTHSRL